MMKRLLTISCLLFFMAASGLKAQLYIGPALSGGMTYGKNFIVDDTSRFYIENAPGIYAAGGLDIAYLFDDRIKAQVGVAYRYKQFNLVAPAGREGLSFSEISRTATAISIPMTVQYRVPLSEGGSTYFNIIAGHSLDITSEDSVVVTSSTVLVDSGLGYTRHEFQNLKRIIPTVLLGAGMDFQSQNGNILNVSIMWGIGTGKIFQGNIREWEVLNQDFDPTSTAEPEEFPEHYFDWALRGSTLSLRASYYFDLSGLFAKKEKVEGDSGEEE